MAPWTTDPGAAGVPQNLTVAPAKWPGLAGILLVQAAMLWAIFLPV